MLTPEQTWQAVAYIIGGLIAISLWFVVRAINDFAKSIEGLKTSLTALASDVRVERVHVMELQEWREKTADPILTQAMHMIYNNFRPRPDKP